MLGSGGIHSSHQGPSKVSHLDHSFPPHQVIFSYCYGPGTLEFMSRPSVISSQIPHQMWPVKIPGSFQAVILLQWWQLLSLQSLGLFQLCCCPCQPCFHDVNSSVYSWKVVHLANYQNHHHYHGLSSTSEIWSSVNI